MDDKVRRFQMRLDEELGERIDRWRGKQSPIPSMATAIRTLCAMALDGEGAKS